MTDKKRCDDEIARCRATPAGPEAMGATIGDADWSAERALLEQEDLESKLIARGMMQMTQGIYADGRGGIHVDPIEVLQAEGYPVTPRNVRKLKKAIGEVIRLAQQGAAEAKEAKRGEMTDEERANELIRMAQQSVEAKKAKEAK